MARRPAAQPERLQRKTALLVGEGFAEKAFLEHLKKLYVERGRQQVTIKTAKGKGGSHVLDYTRRQGIQAAFDHMGALLDTDTDWGAEQRALALALRIEVFEAHPCLEALLLRMAGQRVPHTTAQCKKAFMQKFQAEAHAPGLFERHFPKDMLEQVRKHVPELERLVSFLIR